jgi:hypothetical protein
MNVILPVVALLLVGECQAGETVHHYAPPLAWSNWEKLPTVAIGRSSFGISYTPLGDTLVMGKVKYHNDDCEEIIVEFKDSITVTQGECVSHVWVSLKGVVTGSAVDVRVE